MLFWGHIGCTDIVLLFVFKKNYFEWINKSEIIDVQCIIDKMDLENKTAVCTIYKLIYCKLNDMVDFIEMSVKIVHWTRTTVEVLIEIFSFKGLKMLFYMYIVCTNKCSTGIRVKKDGDEKVRVYWHPLAVIFTPFWAHARLHTNWTLYDIKLCQKYLDGQICSLGNLSQN